MTDDPDLEPERLRGILREIHRLCLQEKIYDSHNSILALTQPFSGSVVYETLNERTLRLLEKHYDLQQSALNEIAEEIALFEGDSVRELVGLVDRIDDIAAKVRCVCLLNPNGIERSRDTVEQMEWDRPSGSIWHEIVS